MNKLNDIERYLELRHLCTTSTSIRRYLWEPTTLPTAYDKVNGTNYMHDP